MRTPPAGGDASASRLNTTAYPPSANGYDYYRRPAGADRSDYGAGGGGGGQDYYASPPRNNSGYDRPPAQQQQGGNSGGGYGMQQQSKPYDSQTALQTQPIFF